MLTGKPGRHVLNDAGSPNSPRPQPFNAANRKRYGVPGSSAMRGYFDRSGKFSDVKATSNFDAFHTS